MGKFTTFRNALFESELTLFDADTLKAIDDVIAYINKDRSEVYWHGGSSLGDNWFSDLGWRRLDAELEKMQDYKRNGSKPKRIASACKESEIGKLLWRYKWCLKNWPDAIEDFKEVVRERVNRDYSRDVQKTIIENQLKAQKAAEAVARKIEEERIAAEKQAKKDAINNAKRQKLNNSISDRSFTPSDRDWEKMIDYMNRKSDPQRLASSCKDGSKVVARYIIAECLGWKAAAAAFKEKAIIQKFATEEELQDFYNKYINNIPEQWEGYVQAVREDPKSGLNTIGTDNDKIDKRIQKILDNSSTIESYEYVGELSTYYLAPIVKLTAYSGTVRYLVYQLWDNKKWFDGYNIFWCGLFNELPRSWEDVTREKSSHVNRASTMQGIKYLLSRKIENIDL